MVDRLIIRIIGPRWQIFVTDIGTDTVH